MELALPLLALGGWYVISKSSHSKSTAESFAPMPSRDEDTQLYYNQQAYQQQVNNHDPKVTGDIPNIYSALSGTYLSPEEFTHTNMLPFNGGKVRGGTYNMNVNESIMDNMTGSASQVIHKTEQAPLFRPEENLQWSHGMPNQSDFLQSRVNAPMRQGNTKPFESIHVAPGLNQGYTTEGMGGLNASMQARDQWMPKTVNELRVASNPKIEYELADHQGPAYSHIHQPATVQTQGRVEKYRPDRYFDNGPERWFTTTGVEKGPTLRAEQFTGNIRREDAASNYMGHAEGNVKATYAPRNYEPAKRSDALPGGINPSSAIGHGDYTGLENRLLSTHVEPTKRSTMPQPESFGSGFSRAIGAVVAPLMDVLRPTRKEELIHNNHVGNLGTTVSETYAHNPNDVARTTIKETTLYTPQFYVNSQTNGMYINTLETPEWTKRDQTSTEYFHGAKATESLSAMSYEAAYNQRNNDIKSQTIHSRTAVGNTQVFNPMMNVQHLKPDKNAFDGRLNPAHSRVTSVPPSTQILGHQSSRFNVAENQNNRMDPSLLTPFLNNPYTHSLQSVA